MKALVIEQLVVNQERLGAELIELASFSEAPGAPVAGGDVAVTRVVYSEHDLQARAWLRRLAEDAGLEVREDAVGNTFFRWHGTEPRLAGVATGSHIDAIPNAGMYDGTVGVIGGLEAIRALQATGFHPRRSIELILFTSEEPTRFGIGCLGSRMMSGALTAEAARGLRDKQDATLEELRSAAGYLGELSAVETDAGRYHAFIELHIEQGPELERTGVAVGVVTAIAAPAAGWVSIEGEGGHAGALSMPERHDALSAAAEVILAVEGAARGTGASDTVATVGACEVFPGAVNSVPSRVRLSLDVRDIDQGRRDAVLREIENACEEIGTRRRVRMTMGTTNADSPVSCSTGILRTIEEVCADAGVPAERMVSRAYHDTLFMARLCPVAMIFIPCRGGVSHRPDEYATPEAIASGTRVLAATLAALSMETP